MEFSTPVALDDKNPKISHKDTITTIGSCFSNEIGHKLKKAKFQFLSNPYGVLFNPVSIFSCLSMGFLERLHQSANLVRKDGKLVNYLVHSEVWTTSENEFIQRSQELTKAFHSHLNQSNFVFFTFGTAWVYRHRTTNQIVASCHKQPSGSFEKQLLSPEEIVQGFQSIQAEALTDKTIILTVSPIRHLRDGLPENQISKSILRYACHLLSDHFRKVHYFPSYEIVLDELRDYRFYQDDMTHPTSLAIDYIWEKFQSSWFQDETIALIKKWLKVTKGLEHRPFQRNGLEYQQFLESLKTKIASFSDVFSVKEELDTLAELAMNSKK